MCGRRPSDTIIGGKRNNTRKKKNIINNSNDYFCVYTFIAFGDGYRYLNIIIIRVRYFVILRNSVAVSVLYRHQSHSFISTVAFERVIAFRGHALVSTLTYIHMRFLHTGCSTSKLMHIIHIMIYYYYYFGGRR